MKIIENFLEDGFFKSLKELIVEGEFEWFQRKNMVPNTNNDIGYFTHSFYNKDNINSNYYMSYINPILDKLEVKSVIEVRANLSPSSFYKEDASAFHIDYPYKKSKTAILYLNTCNGGTELKINDEIKFVKAEENKIVIFDTTIQHRGTKSTDADFRYIINFNYF